MKFRLAFAFLFLAAVGHAQVGTTYSQGKSRLSLTAGYGSWDDRDYAVIGAGAGYYLLDGLEVGVDGDAWVGSKPQFYSVSPEARYILNYSESFKPYIGGFYKRTFYSSLEDLNSAGGRAGLVSPIGEHTHLSAGVVFEKFFECDEDIYDSCTRVYPELSISFSY
jgi:hypothetical protein